MSNRLIFTDLHIKKTELIECGLVLDELVSLANKHDVNEVYDLGDTFDILKPESECLDLFSNFIKKLGRPLIVLAANSHESTTKEDSIMNHFGILHDNVKIVKEYIDEDYMFGGHFFLNESNINYGAKRSAGEFAKYKYVFLGHQHSMQAVAKNIMHVGACRYIDFAESQDKAKVVVLIEHYKSNAEKAHILGLKSVYPMKDVYLDPKGEKVAPASAVAKSEEEFKAILDNLPQKTKVRVIFKDFKSYTQVINSLKDYHNKFVLFQEKKEFIISEDVLLGTKKEGGSLKESLIKYVEANNIPEEIKKILLEKISG
jgi:DNA repair exonuclease SbcCD nuclease subunit